MSDYTDVYAKSDSGDTLKVLRTREMNLSYDYLVSQKNRLLTKKSRIVEKLDNEIAEYDAMIVEAKRLALDKVDQPKEEII